MNKLVRIATLNNSPGWTDKIKIWLNNLNGFEIINFEFTFFTHSSLLVEYILENNIDLLLLEYDMLDINGSDLARKLQIISPDTKIIFITGSKVLSPVSIVDNCIGLIQKRTTEEKFLFEINNAIKKITNIHLIEIKHFTRVHNAETNRTKKITSISAIDAVKIKLIQASQQSFENYSENVTTVFLEDQTSYATNTSLKKWLTILDSPDLIRITQSEIINLKYIKNVDEYDIQLLSGETFTIGRSYKREFKLKWHDLLMKGVRSTR